MNPANTNDAPIETDTLARATLQALPAPGFPWRSGPAFRAISRPGGAFLNNSHYFPLEYAGEYPIRVTLHPADNAKIIM